ncbi:hypothetical protein EC957_009192 [Mortierella hygrophila]|uniref:Uncharacterized protein n=1 Tax=Mortierella hygrophila TaxID=979708 RepID=A0A9P6FI80_9FUNG|nr:hypothetical protein EC957_009192 [Mortierella hygrophila]
MVFYVDGAPALEKKETHHGRNEKRAMALKTAKVAVETLSNRVSQGKPPTKQMFKNVEKSLRGGFKCSLRDWEECQPKDVVLSQDSDFFPYDSVTTFWRPVGKRYEVKVLEYDREAVLARIKLSTTKLTALACVSSNDQNKNPLLCQQYKLAKDHHTRAKEQKSQGNSGIKSDAKPNRQGKHRGFRRHRVIDRPAHQPGVSRQVHRPRHSYKARPEPQQHEQLSIRKQYQRKPYTAEHEARYRQSIAEAKGKKANKTRQREAQRLKKEKKLAKKPPLKIDEMDKMHLINAMVWGHPLVSLPVGTVSVNSKRTAAAATTDASQLPPSEQQQQHQQQEVSACILETRTRVSESIHRDFFERGLTEDDRTILSFLCPAVESKICVMPQPHQGSQASSSSPAGTPTGTPAEDEYEGDAEVDGNEDMEDNGDEDAEPSAMDKPIVAFYQILLAHIYSRKIKSKTVAERQVGQLLARATSLDITLPPVPQRTVSYPTTGLLESTTTQLYSSVKMMYRNGSVALEKKINSQAHQPGTILPKIDPKLPAIENYLLLNKACGGSRRIAPLSPLASRYVGFSERHLLPLFWHWPALKDKIRRMMVEDRYFQDPAIVPAQADSLNWLTKTTTDRLVTTFLTDVGLPPDKHDKGYRKVITAMDVDGKEGLQEHRGCLRAETFDPKEWDGKGYVLKGSIWTNGRLLQLLEFKLKELQSARYRRVPEDRLPNPLVTTIGGTNSYLTEACNVLSATADLESPLAADPSQVAVLSLDWVPLASSVPPPRSHLARLPSH